MAMLNNQMVVNGKDYPFFIKGEASKNESSLDELKKNGEKSLLIYLVGGFNQPLWKMMEWKSVGMMTFPYTMEK